MLKYKNYKVIRADENNIELYKIENREVYKGTPGVRGKPRPTGEFADQDTFLGFYRTPGNALNKIIDMELTDCSDLKDVLNKIKELQTWKKEISLA